MKMLARLVAKAQQREIMGREPTNQERAERIKNIIETVPPYSEDQDDWQAGVTDLLTDVMHFCRKFNGVEDIDLDFDKETEWARKHFDAEVHEELEGRI